MLMIDIVLGGSSFFWLVLKLWSNLSSSRWIVSRELATVLDIVGLVFLANVREKTSILAS